MFKKNAKILLILLVVALLVTSALCLCACDGLKDFGKPAPDEGSKSVSVVIGEQSYSLKTDAEYVQDLLVEMKDAGKIQYEFSTSQYGAYMTRLNDLSPSSSSEWIAVYHDIDDMTLKDMQYGEAIQKGGKSYFTASLGVSSLPVRNGASYLFIIKSM